MLREDDFAEILLIRSGHAIVGLVKIEIVCTNAMQRLCTLVLDGLFEGCDSLRARNVDEEDTTDHATVYPTVKSHVWHEGGRRLSHA